MALECLLAAGFEGGTTAILNENGWIQSGVTVETTAGLVHKSLLSYGGNYSVLIPFFGYMKTPSFSTTARWLYFWVKWSDLSTVGGVQFGRSGTRQLSVEFQPATGRVILMRAGVAVATSAASAWNPNQHHWVSIKLVAAVAGSCTVYFNGTSILTYSGDTRESGVDGWDQMSFGSNFSGAGLSWAGLGGYVDDLMVTDDNGGAAVTPLPECFGLPIVPSAVASGNLTGVPTTGANRFQNIDELPSSTTDYNLAAAINDEDLYALTNPPTVGTVHAVSIWAEVARNGDITQGAVHTVSGASDTYGTVTSLPAAPSYGVVNRLHSRNPDGDVAWTLSSLSALQVGFKFS